MTVVDKEGASAFCTTSTCVEAEPEAEELKTFDTNYDANNVLVDRPIAKDLNSTEAVKMVMEYGTQLLKKVTGKEVENDEWKDVEKVMDKYGAALLGDGNPTHMMHNIKRRRRIKRSISSFEPLLGGFI